MISESVTAEPKLCGEEISPVVLRQNDKAPCEGLLFSTPHASEINAEIESFDRILQLEREIADSRCAFSNQKYQTQFLLENEVLRAQLTACKERPVQTKFWEGFGIGVGAAILMGGITVGVMLLLPAN